MALSIKELRAKINASQKQQNNNFDSSSVFSFSKLNIGDQVRIRFVDDGEPNDFFWRVRDTRTLRFDSIRLANGSVVDNRTFVSVPAFNIKKGDANLANLPEDYLYYSNDDVINQKIKPFWDGTEEGQALYNKFGRKETYIFQGFVRAEGYETKLYRFVINKDLFNVIYSFISDDEIEHTPSDSENGRDFILKVTKKIANINGKPQEVKDYSTSKWSSNESPLTDSEKSWLAENKPFVLKQFIPSRPTTEQEQAMLELFEASYNSEPYDVVRWGKIFKPDNVFFDEQGNIKDLKNGNKGATTTATEIPATTYVAPQQAPVVTAPQVVETVAQPQINVEALAQMIAAQAQAQAQQVEAPKPTAPQLISQNSETVAGANTADVINNIMAKFNIQPQA